MLSPPIEVIKDNCLGSSALTLGLVLIWICPACKVVLKLPTAHRMQRKLRKNSLHCSQMMKTGRLFSMLFLDAKTLDQHAWQYLKYWNSFWKSEISPQWSHLVHQGKQKILKSQAGIRDRILKKVSFVGSHHFVHINVLHHKSEGHTCLGAFNGQKKAWSHQEQHVAGKAQQDIVDGKGNAPEGFSGNIRPHTLGVFARFFGFSIGSNAVLNEQRQHRFPWTLQHQMDHQKAGSRAKQCRYVDWYFVVWCIGMCLWVTNMYM